MKITPKIKKNCPLQQKYNKLKTNKITIRSEMIRNRLILSTMSVPTPYHLRITSDPSPTGVGDGTSEVQ